MSSLTAVSFFVFNFLHPQTSKLFLFVIVICSMVKERKAQTGATNLSARSDTNQNEKSNAGPSKFFRSWTHKLVSPDEYHARDPNLDKVREISNTATWLPLKIHSRDFNSTSSASFRDPRTIPVKQKKVRTIQEIEEDDKRLADQRESVTSLCKLATRAYGTTAAMMKSASISENGLIRLAYVLITVQQERHRLDSYRRV